MVNCPPVGEFAAVHVNTPSTSSKGGAIKGKMIADPERCARRSDLYTMDMPVMITFDAGSPPVQLTVRSEARCTVVMSF